jgi:alkylation response protein AidB-like acyl-CoA dehydrogenase
MATIHRWDGRRLGLGSASAIRAWWRVALAVEICGTARAALDRTLIHVRERHQFGRPLGSFQALQHRLAECAVLVEGARWLALEAAWSRAEPERAAAAAVQALRAGERTFWETHQVSGALGFTVEYDLHLWTMRLPALRAELLSIGQPAAALTSARWSPTMP